MPWAPACRTGRALSLGSMIRHLHDFIREVELTNEEWFEGVRFVNSIGKTTTNTRNEAHRISDVLGVES